VKKTIVIAAGVLLVLGIAAFFLLRDADSESKYETQAVDRGDIIEKIAATGTINPVITVKVGSQVSGRIEKIFADFNSQVQKGQLIAQLVTDIYQSKVAQNDANYKLAQAQRQEARVALADAESGLRRIKNLSRELVASERELEMAETTFNAARATFDAALAREAQAQALLHASKVDLEHTSIYSPVDGIVISRNCDVGQTVIASFQTPDLFHIAQDLTKMQVEASVDEADIGKVQLEQKVLFTVDAFPDRVFQGKVSQIRFAPKEEQNVVTYATVVEVDNPDLSLRPGMTATVSVITSEKKSILRIPTVALRFKADPEDKDLLRQETENGQEPGNPETRDELQQRIWVEAPGGEVKPLLLKTGISDGRFTEIVSGSLQEGEKVIVGYRSQWKQKHESKGSGFRFGFRQLRF
jgi:HlyD family secretion protein